MKKSLFIAMLTSLLPLAANASDTDHNISYFDIGVGHGLAVVEWGLSLSVAEMCGIVAVILVFGALSVIAAREYTEL